MTLVVPWREKGTTGSYRSCYYMVPINVEGKELKRNTYYKINLEVGILGSFVPEEPTPLEPSYIILDWGKAGIDANLQTYKYLVVDETYKEIYNQTTCEIGYSSSSDITIKVDSVTYPSYATGNERINKITNQSQLAAYRVSFNESTFTLEHSLADPSRYFVPYTMYLKITNTDGMTEYVTIVQYPSLYITTSTGGNAFVNGYFAHVVGATFGTQATNNGTYRYSYDYNNNSNSGFRGNTVADHYVNTGYGRLQAGLTASSISMENTTNIYVTAFNSSNNTYSDGSRNETYRIGDPRVENTENRFSLDPYLTGQSGGRKTTASWTNPREILIATAERNIIAPAYKISSGWGRLGSTPDLTLDAARKRCATYQEAGYPAGRWRLPTEAEIKFVTNLQARELIPNLFVDTNNYWASSGRVVRNNAFDDPGRNATVYCRCVYDIWYWGEDTEYSTNVYHADAPKK